MLSDPAVWFENGSRVWKPPEDVKRDHERFKTRLGRLLKFKKRDITLASTKDELLKQIDDAKAQEPSYQTAVDGFDEAVKRRDEYQEQRQAGARKAGSKLQNGLSAFADFVGSYSSILGAVAEAGGPYGMVGYQTLSALLIVFVTKTRNDNRLLSHIEDLRRSVAKLDSWEGIYRTDDMRELVSSCYGHVVEFSRSAAEYFSSFWDRFWFAINPASAPVFDDAAAAIHRALAGINAEAMHGLHTRTQLIASEVSKLRASEAQAQEDRRLLIEQNQELSDRIKVLHARNEERELQEDARRVNAFHELLGVHLPHPGVDAATTKTALMSVFPNTARTSPGVAYTSYLQMSEVMLQGLAEYGRWLAADSSSLLFLSGATAREGRKLTGCTHCWLSPAAIYVKEALDVKKQRVAFFSCQPELMSHSETQRQVLAAVIVQILQWKPHLLRARFDDYKHILDDGLRNGGNLWDKRGWGTPNSGAIGLGIDHSTSMMMPMMPMPMMAPTPPLESQPLKPLVILLAALLTDMKQQEDDDSEDGDVYIVIDRVDRCDDPDINTIMNELAWLVSELDDTSVRVKIVVVAETSMGRGNWQLGFLSDREYNRERVFAYCGWNQRRLTPVESSEHFRPLTWDTRSAVVGLTET